MSTYIIQIQYINLCEFCLTNPGLFYGVGKDVIILEVTSAQKIVKTTKCYCFIFVWFQVGFIRPIIKRSITFSGDLNRFNKRQIKMI